MDELISIGEFSQHSGLSPKRLRSYASAGLLIPAAVDAASGYRYYSLGQLRNARLIDALREAGMSLADIASFLRRPRQDDLDRWAQRVIVDAERRQEAVGLARRLVAMEVHEARVDQEVRRGERSMATMRMAARTDIGRVRESNEDMVLTSERLAAVADGMGGHPGGEVAAVAAVSAIRAAFTGRSVDELLAGVRAANFAIWDRARTSPDLEGMGTTICAVGLTDDGQLVAVNVGDSRAYLQREGSMSQITDDHSVTAELVQRGELSEEDAIDHPQHKVLTRVLGGGPDVEPDSVLLRARDGDRLLLCTDGLVNEVGKDQIAPLLADAQDGASVADALVELAVSNGGQDNVSVVVIDVIAAPPTG